MFFLYRNEYKIFKLAEITIRMGLGRKEKKRADNLGYNTYIHGNVTRKLSV
jgi:hypothetical protein